MTTTGMPEVLIAYRHPLIADALASALSRAGMRVVGAYATVAEAAAAAAREPVDVVVLGPVADLPRPSAARLLKQSTPAAVLVVAEEHDSEGFVPAMEAGASGYITLSCSGPQLADAVARVAVGEIVVIGVGRVRGTTQAQTHVPEHLTRAADHERAPVALTAREHEIMRLICAGRSNQQIARELFISAHTVRTHIQNIRAKLNVRSKLEAALIALANPEHAANAAVDVELANARLLAAAGARPNETHPDNGWHPYDTGASGVTLR